MYCVSHANENKENRKINGEMCSESRHHDMANEKSF